MTLISAEYCTCDAGRYAEYCHKECRPMFKKLSQAVSTFFRASCKQHVNSVCVCVFRLAVSFIRRQRSATVLSPTIKVRCCVNRTAAQSTHTVESMAKYALRLFLAPVGMPTAFQSPRIRSISSLTVFSSFNSLRI